MSGRENYARYLVFLFVFVVVGCQRAPSDFTTANKEVVRQWFSALDAQDYDALTNLMDEQFVVPARIIDGADRAVGRNATFELIRGFYRSFPDYTHDIEEMIGQGRRWGFARPQRNLMNVLRRPVEITALKQPLS